MSDLNNLELRLKRIEDQLELLRLEGAYAFFFDRKEAQAWAGLFTEDGAYSRRQLAGMGEPIFIQGRANLAKYCESNRISCVHMLHLPHFVIDGDTATSSSDYVMFTREGDGAWQVLAAGRYQDRLARHAPDGTWRFVERTLVR